MLKIGITGGIGSGKTTVSKIFETLDVPIFNADNVAKQIMVTDSILIEAIKTTFGHESYFATGILNRKHIAAIVFNNEKELQKLNAIVHPAVFRAFNAWVKAMPTNTPYVLKEAALLFESGSDALCDKTILVTAPLNIKITRVMQRDGITETEVKARMDKQFSDKQKFKLADFFIENTEEKSVIMQVLALHHQFLAL